MVLFTLTAKDLMSSDMVIVPQNMSLRGAAHLLASGKVTGAPVVNDRGVCIGVLSSADFVHAVGEEYKDEQPQDVTTSSQIVDKESRYPVKEFMDEPVFIPPDLNIVQIAGVMTDAHSHRAIVTVDGKPVGVVSATDIIAALAKCRS